MVISPPRVRAVAALLTMAVLAVSAQAAPAAKHRPVALAVDVSAYGAAPSATPTDNVAAINRALRSQRDVRITRPGVYQINDHLTIYSHTRLVCSPGVTVQQIASVCIIRNAHLLGTPPDTDITIDGGTWDGNYIGHSPGDQISPTDLTNPLRGVDGEIDAIGVNFFTLQNALIQHCRAFGVQVTKSNDVTVRNVRLDIAKDGLHINGPAARMHIAHVSGYTGDDFIAFNAWDWLISSPTAGDITDVDIDDITQLAQSPTVPGNTNQYGLIKFNAGTRQGQTGNVKRIRVSHVRGVNSYRAFTFLIDYDPQEHVTAGPGVVSDIRISHVAVRTVHSPLFWLGQNISDLTVNDLQIDPASTGPIVYVNNNTTTHNLSINGMTMTRAQENPFDVRGSIGTLRVNYARLFGAASDFLTPKPGGSIGNVLLYADSITAPPATK